MKNRAAFSLIELIISVTLIAVVMYAAIAIFITSGVRNASVETFSRAQSLAEGKLEEKLARSFAKLSGEAMTALTGDFAGFSSEVVVNYVATADLNTVVATSEYKRVRVRIYYGGNTRPISVESIKASP